MYAEATERLPGTHTDMISAPLSYSTVPRCLQFYYNMYGDGVGSLSVMTSSEYGYLELWTETGELRPGL